MAVNNTAGMSASLMKQYWHEKFLDELRSNLVLRDLGQVGTVPAGEGVTVHWLSMADMSLHTTAATEGKIGHCLLKIFSEYRETLRYLTNLLWCVTLQIWQILWQPEGRS